MALIKWPDSLPLPLLKSHSMKQSSGLLSTKMDSGYTRTRRKFTNRPTAMSSSFLFSCEQYAVFEGFVEHQINGGADWFLLPVKLPVGVVDSEVRIVPDSISDKLLTNHLWSVSVKFEIRKREKIDIGTTELLIAEGADSLYESVKILKQVYK